MNNRFYVAAIALITALLVWATPVYGQDGGDLSEEIIYIDSAGFIRIIDPVQGNQNTAIQWRSEEGGWHDAAMADVNGDGDFEIVAIRGEVFDGLLTVYDPVVNDSLVTVGGRINGVPWSRLYDLPLPGRPDAVTTGNFSDLSAADEFAVAVSIFAEDDSEVITRQDVSIYRTIDTRGQAWTPTVDARRFSNRWTHLYSGNLDNVGLDELVLLDDDLSALVVYRVDNGLDDVLDRIFNNESESKPWASMTAGRFTSTRIQMAAVREAPLGLSNLLVSEYGNETLAWDDMYAEQFLPSPRVVFDGDINNDGTDELFMLRSVPTDVAARPRLFMRNLGGNTLVLFEDFLDADNGYRAGAAGDTDGDQNDEVVIMRDNRIRVYRSPELGIGDKVEYLRATNSKSVDVADVDTNGYLPPPAFDVDPEILSRELARGRLSSAVDLTVSNAADHGSFPFQIEIDDNVTWLYVAPLGERTTPTTFQIYFDARALRVGSYATDLRLVAPESAGVTNNGYLVNVNLSVTQGISALPSTVVDRRSTCAAGQEPREWTISVAGATGSTVSARIVDENDLPMPWATVEPVAGESPLTLTVRTIPARDGVHFAVADLIVDASNGEMSMQTSVQIYLQCAVEILYLPTVNRN